MNTAEPAAAEVIYTVDRRRATLSAAELLRSIASEARRIGAAGVEHDDFAIVIADALCASAARLDEAAKLFRDADAWLAALEVELDLFAALACGS